MSQNQDYGTYREIAAKAMHGTTTVGILCSDGVVLGADSRASMDTFLASPEAVKINMIDENLGMTIAGSVGDAQYLVKILKAQNELYKMNEGRSMSPNAATSFLSVLLQENKMMPFMVGLIVGGMSVDGPALYSLDAIGGLIKESKFISVGSGQSGALGYLEDVYKEGKTVQEMARHAAKAIKIAMKRDIATGDTIHIAMITKAGYKEVTAEQLESSSK